MAAGAFAAHARNLLAAAPDTVENVVVLAQTESTNLLARHVVAEYFACDQEAPAAALVALEQTSGRGRRGRRWASPAGTGVYASLIRPLRDPGELRLMPLRVGVALCGALNGLLAGHCRLKWPNDLVVRGRKIGGILIEAVQHGSLRRAAIVGFGVNRGQPNGALAVPGATSLLQEAGAAPPLAELTAALLAAVDSELRATGEPAELVAAYAAMSAHRPGDRLRCRIAERSVDGAFARFGPDGSLVLTVAGGSEERIGAAELVAEATPAGEMEET